MYDILSVPFFISATSAKYFSNVKSFATSSGSNKVKNEKKVASEPKPEPKDDFEKEQKEQQRMQEEETKKREASWKTMKYSFIVFGGSFALFGGYTLFQLGRFMIMEKFQPCDAINAKVTTLS